jgi:four helix bundle protein
MEAGKSAETAIHMRWQPDHIRVMAMTIKSHRELDVFRKAMDLAVEVHYLIKRFPESERHNLSDQFLRSSRSVPANIAEAWRKRRYNAHFASKISDAQAEAAETQVWLELSSRINYIDDAHFSELFNAYEVVLAQLTVMSRDAHKWTKR